MKKAEFDKPTDVKRWWMAPCCGPGSTDPDTYECGFCDHTGRGCAEQNSEIVAGVVQLVPGQEGGEGSIDPAVGMGKDGKGLCNCGFWCKGCGRFWAGDCCGGSGIPDVQSADGAEMEVRGSEVYCVCGRKVAVGYEGEGE